MPDMPDDPVMSDEEAARIKRQYRQDLLSRKGVSGLGIERDAHGPILAVYLEAVDGLGPSLPEQIEGLRIKAVKAGAFRASS